MSKYYYHGLKEGFSIERRHLCIDKMIEIISSGGLKSRAKRGINLNGGFNGNDYISLCKKLPMDDYIENPSQSFFPCILNNYCFIISNEVDAIKPRIISKDDYDSWEDIKLMLDTNPDERISDLVDEWQVKDEIPLKYIVGLGFPFKELEYYKNQSEEMKEKIEKLFELAKELNLDIVDTESIGFIEKYEYQKEINPKVKKFSMNYMED